jgi:hypothetical protein
MPRERRQEPAHDGRPGHVAVVPRFCRNRPGSGRMGMSRVTRGQATSPAALSKSEGTPLLDDRGPREGLCRSNIGVADRHLRPSTRQDFDGESCAPRHRQGLGLMGYPTWSPGGQRTHPRGYGRGAACCRERSESPPAEAQDLSLAGAGCPTTARSPRPVLEAVGTGRTARRYAHGERAQDRPFYIRRQHRSASRLPPPVAVLCLRPEIDPTTEPKPRRRRHVATPARPWGTRGPEFKISGPDHRKPC